MRQISVICATTASSGLGGRFASVFMGALLWRLVVVRDPSVSQAGRPPFLNQMEARNAA